MSRRAFLQLCASATLLSLGGRSVGANESFDFAIETPGAEFSWSAAAFAWEFSQLAYRSKQEIQAGKVPSQGIPAHQLTDFPGPPGLALHDTQVLAWQREQDTVIAYRGTEGTRALSGLDQGEYGKEVLDILTDLRFYQKGLGPADGAARVHSGFFEAVEETWSFVEAILDTGKPATFVGHSLGGGLATYGAYKARAQGKNVSAVWTFGSPRVGAPEFATAYNEALGEVTYRFANELDVVTRLPVRGFHGIPLLPEYRHVGKPIALWSDGHVDSEWAELMSTMTIDEQVVSTFFEDFSLAPHLVYEPALYAQNHPVFVASFAAEEGPPRSLLRAILDLAGLQDLRSQKGIDAFRARWRLD